MTLSARTSAACFQSPSAPKPYPAAMSRCEANPGAAPVREGLRSGGEPRKPALFEEPFDAELDARLIPDVLVERAALLARGSDLVRVGILFYQRIYRGVRNIVNHLNDVTDP